MKFAIALMLMMLPGVPFSATAQKAAKDSVRHPTAKGIKKDSTARAPQRPRKDTVMVYFSQKKIDSLLSNGPADKVWRLLGLRAEQATYLVVTRNKPGEVEVHEGWDDIVVVRSGHAVIKTGNHVKDQKVSGQRPMREWIGGVIEDVEQRTLAPGDFLIIPAMVAHQYIPAKNETFTYWTIKVKNQQKQNPRSNPRQNPAQKANPQKN